MEQLEDLATLETTGFVETDPGARKGLCGRHTNGERLPRKGSCAGAGVTVVVMVHDECRRRAGVDGTDLDVHRAQLLTGEPLVDEVGQAFEIVGVLRDDRRLDPTVRRRTNTQLWK
jgi:hypothetical protein